MAEPLPRASNLSFVLRALKYPNYRLFFTGQIVSLVGSWLSIVATSWLVYRLANAADPDNASVMLGLVNFAGQVPLFALAPFAGVWVDRLNQHRTLIVTQALSMLQSFALAFLALKHVIIIPHVIVLNLFQGLVNALDVPTRQAFVVKMVENRDDLSNAIALNSSMVHGARLVGPAVAGVLIYRFGEGTCFLVDGFSYLAVLLALLLMKVKPAPRAEAPARPWRAFKEGLAYAFGFPPTRTLLVMVAAVSLLAASQSVLMPLFASRVLGGGERAYGLLLGASGVGAFAGSIYLASRRTILGLGNVIAVTGGAFGLGLVAFSFSHYLWLSMGVMLVTGAAMVVQFAASNTVLQTLTDDRMRGRVMSLFAMCFMGVAPFGALLAGGAARAIGAGATLALAGGGIAVASALFALQLPSLRPLVRPVYAKRGIIPEVADGMRAAEATPE